MEMLVLDRQHHDESLPCDYATAVVECYLASSLEDPQFFTWTGPSLLSPLTRTEDVFQYASTVLSAPVDWLQIHLMIVHKYTFESVAVSPFFLPRVECTLGNLTRCRKQITEVIHPYVRSISHADYGFQLFVWPRVERERDTVGRAWVSSGIDQVTPGRILNPERIVENVSWGFEAWI